MSSMQASAEWILALFQGPLIIGLAVIAVAMLGFNMLAGRLRLHKAFQAILGCFLLVGSGAIAQSLMGFRPVETMALPLSTTDFEDRERVAMPPSITRPPAAQPVARGNPFDPYAGNQPMD